MRPGLALIILLIPALGAGLLAWDWAWTWRLIMLVAILFAALPLASHALGRAVASSNEAE